jgi:ankyrin repeat protein
MSLPLTNAERETFLLFFVQNNFLSALNLLLTKNEVNINSISANGNTPLITAAELGYTECLGVLLNKCSKESVRKRQKIILHKEKQKGFPFCVCER